MVVTVDDHSLSRHVTAPRHHGSQLGLGAVAAIVDAHGGTFTYEDGPTGRSCVVTLPR